MNIYKHKAISNSGQEIDLSNYKGKTLLIVNTASACGFTPQYEELEILYKKYQDQGLEILAFPCNQFGKQESGNNDEIKTFCDLNFNISFPLFSKVDVNGENAHPLFNELKKAAPGLLGTEKIKWNFTKFLINKNGGQVTRFAPKTKPMDLVADIEKIL